MKSIIERTKKQENYIFPCLLSSTADDEEVIILATRFTDKSKSKVSGVLIYPEDSNDYELGETEEWITEVFKPFTGSITLQS